jgi:hypothetical protein
MLMSFEARIRQIDWLVSGCSVRCQGPRDTDRGRLQRIPTAPYGVARYPLGRAHASFDFEQLTQPCVWDRYHGIAHGGRRSGAGLNMTEQVPEDLTEAEVADRREADRSKNEGDTVSEVDRWDDEGGHDRVG